MYLLYFKNITLDVSIGIHSFERAAAQPFRVSLTLMMDEARSDADDIAAVVDYDFFRDTVKRAAATKHWELQETLCAQIARECAAVDGVLGAVVKTCKPSVYDDVDEVGCIRAHLTDGMAQDFPWWSLNV